MNIKISRPEIHLAYWIFVIVILTLIFGHSWGNRTAAFYFVVFLLPIVLGTSYFFNLFLIPKYLLKKKYFRFVLYTLYTFIISLYLESLVLLFSYVYLANFSFENMDPRASDTLVLAAVMYLVVLLGSFIVMVYQLTSKQNQIKKLLHEKDKEKPGFIEVISQRKSIKIPFEDILYIESLADYILINTSGLQKIRSKEKISTMEKKLPGSFIRIHRSFIINVNKINTYSTTAMTVAGKEFTIGRSYKQNVLDSLDEISNTSIDK